MSKNVIPNPTPSRITYALKQLLRRQTDGALIAKDEIYKPFNGYQFVQSVPTLVWEIYHNKQSTNFIEQIYLDNTYLSQAEVQIIDSCKIQIIFSTPVSGFVNMIFMNDIPTVSTCYYATPTPTPVISLTPSNTPTLTPITTVSNAIIQSAFSSTNIGNTIILSNNNTTVGTTTIQSNEVSMAVSNSSKSEGKYYIEMEVTSTTSDWAALSIGIIGSIASLNHVAPESVGLGSTDYGSGGNYRQLNSFGTSRYQISNVPTVSVGQIVRIAVDFDAGHLWITYIGNVSSTVPTASTWVGGGNPSNGTLPTLSIPPNIQLWFACSPCNAGQTITLVSPSNWNFPAPTGFGVWT